MPCLSRTCVAVALALAAAVPLSGRLQSAPQSRAASERAPGLTVDFLAVQADGSPAVGLQASEVEIRIDDRIRTVRAVRRVSTGPAPAPGGAAPMLPPPYGTNDSVASGRSFVLVFDEESFPPGREPLVRGAVDGLLANVTPADRAMVVALPFGGIKLPFSSEPARIRQAVERMSGQGTRAETGSELACRTRRFLESLDQLLRRQPGRGAPLTLVVFTGGLAAPRRDAPMGLAPGLCELPVEHFRRVAASASAARANVYLMQPADIGMSAAAWRETIAGVGDRGSDNPLEGIEHLAGVTGGTRLPLDAAGSGSLLRVARETSAYYEAEIEPERNETLGRSRALRVRVSRRGVTARSRPDITLVDTPSRPSSARLTVNDLLASGESFTDVHLRVGGFTVREPEGRLRVGVVVEPVDRAEALASVGAILIADDGTIAGRWFARDPSERPLLGAIAAPPGTYRLRVAAIDAAGRPGAAEDEILAGLTSVGPLSLGSLMLGVSRPEGTALQLQFGSEPVAIASFDIYDGPPDLRLSATLEVARDLDGPALVAVPLALARVDASRVLAKGALPVGALPPGDYVVRGIVRLGDGTAARVTRTLRKVAPAI